MKKIEKAENLEAVRVLLITANDIVGIAERKLAETIPDHIINCQFVEHSLTNLTCQIVQLQNELHGRTHK